MELTPTERLTLAHKMRDDVFTIFDEGVSPVATEHRKITLDDALKAVDVCVAEFNKQSPYVQYLRTLIQMIEGTDPQAASSALAEIQRQGSVLLQLGKEVETILSKTAAEIKEAN